MTPRFTDTLAKASAHSAAQLKKKPAPARRKPGEPGLFTRMERLYNAMEQAYDACAAKAGLSCAGCETNCCTSFFKHHTYVEWAYLWRGLHALEAARRDHIIERAGQYLADARASIAKNLRPSAMCPLNEEGRCILYSHRLMICRMHGTRNVFTLPDGTQQAFPGCVRFTALPCATGANACPSLDRTAYYKELAELEMQFLKKAGRPLPRVDITIAEMIVSGPPKL